MLQITRGTVGEFDVRTHGVSSPTMSQDGQHVAYAARRGKEDFTVILDGEEGPRMEAIPCAPRMSPDGKLHYAGVVEGKVVLFVNGTRAREVSLPGGKWEEKGACIGFWFAEAGQFVVALALPDGTRIITAAEEYKGRFVKAIAGPATRFEGDRFHYARVCRLPRCRQARGVGYRGRQGEQAIQRRVAQYDAVAQ